MFTRKTGKGSGVPLLLMAVLLAGSINLGPPPTHTQPSSPSATPPFNGWLALNDGQAQVPYDTEISLDPANGSFTIEGWIKDPAWGSVLDAIYKKDSFAVIFSHVDYGYPLPGHSIFSVHFSSCRGGVCIANSDKVLGDCAAFSWCPPLGWFHWAYVYDQATNKGAFFWNGAMLSDQQIPNVSTEPLMLRSALSMDEIRISNNVRYSSSFTIPSGPFVCDANTQALWHFDEITGTTTFHDACGATDNLMTGSNGAHTEGVIGQATSTALVSSANPSGVGHSVTFTATVSGSGSTPTGTVAFKDGGTDIAGCSTQPLSSGQAICSTSALTEATHSLTAVYSGDAIYASSTSLPWMQTVVLMFDVYLPSITR